MAVAGLSTDVQSLTGLIRLARQSQPCGSKLLPRLLAIMISCTSLAGYAEATVLTFDDVAVLTGDSEAILGVYGGLNWANMAVVNGSTISGGGYNGGRVSGLYVAYNRFGSLAEVEVENGTFDFLSVYLAAVFRDGLQVRVQGLLDGNLIYEEEVRLPDASLVAGAAAEKFDFNFMGINQLTFASFGGVPAGLGGFGPHFAMDNFEFQSTAAIPEPGSFLVWGALVIPVFLTQHRRKTRFSMERRSKIAGI